MINQRACDIAKEVAAEGDALVAGGICQTPTYLSGFGKEAVQKEFEKQLNVFIENKVDFMIAEVNVSDFVPNDSCKRWPFSIGICNRQSCKD